MNRFKKLLIMGLPGSGKTTLADKVSKELQAHWINADHIRKTHNDWDFSMEGRLRQAERMKKEAEKSVKNGRHCVVDFVCPTEQTRELFDPDVMVFMDTIKEGRFDDTNSIFVPPNKVDLIISEKRSEYWRYRVSDLIQLYKWDENKPSSIIHLFSNENPTGFPRKLPSEVSYNNHRLTLEDFQLSLLETGQVKIFYNTKNVTQNKIKQDSLKIIQMLHNYPERYKIIIN